MADWDPFAIDEAEVAAPAPSSSGGGGGGGPPAESVAKPGSGVRDRKSDLEEVSNALYKQLVVDQPWNRVSDNDPDLTWHEPSCTDKTWNYTDVKLELAEGICYVIMNRPSKNNAVNATMTAALRDALFMLHKRPDIRVVVFMGEGAMFCAGTDVDDESPVAGEKALGPVVQRSHTQLLERAEAAGAFEGGKANISPILEAKQWHTWTTLPQFTIALVNGTAMGSGLGMLACCDMAIVVKQAFLSLSEVKMGLIPATIAPYVVSKIGTNHAKRLFCTGENLTAARAKEIGLVNEVVDDVEAGHKLITEICASVTMCGPRSVEAAKRLVLGVAGQPITEAVMFYTAKMLAKVTVSEEARAGMIAIQIRATKPWEVNPIAPKY